MTFKLLITICLLLFVAIIFQQNGGFLQENEDKFSHRLYMELQKEQYQKSSSFFGLIKHTKGLYGSDVKLNMLDKKNSMFYHFMRENMNIPDNNMFVTSFVLYSLIEANLLKEIEIDKKSFEEAVRAILLFQDKNYDKDIPIYTFWEQKLINGTYECYPENLLTLVNLFFKLPVWLQDVIGYIIGMGPDMIRGYIQAFRIPSDSDDVSINLILGGYLKIFLPEFYKIWSQNNTQYDITYKKLKEFSYRPFQNETGGPYNISNKIDPRTYMYIHEFVDQAKQKAIQDGVKPQLILFTTWITNEYKEISDEVNQPFHVNNVDATVNANALLGLNTFLSTFDRNYTDQIFDDELKTMMINSTNFVKWAIESKIMLKRPDLALTYYPSIINFYWFVARTYHFLKNYRQLEKYPEQKYCRETLEILLKNVATQQLLDSKLTDEKGNIYWVQFLGNYAGINRNEDMFYNTAVAVAALLEIWTTKSNYKSFYDEDTPLIVKQTIENSLNFLRKELLKPGTSKMNTFFSGSVKGLFDFPYIYPGNSATYANGTTINPNNSTEKDVTDDLVYAFKGYVSNDQFNLYVNNYTWFGYKTPQKFNGFNQRGFSFPFWSAKSITLSMTLLAEAKFNSIINK